jgi:hypothetical protein
MPASLRLASVQRRTIASRPPCRPLSILAQGHAASGSGDPLHALPLQRTMLSPIGIGRTINDTSCRSYRRLRPRSWPATKPGPRCQQRQRGKTSLAGQHPPANVPKRHACYVNAWDIMRPAMMSTSASDPLLTPTAQRGILRGRLHWGSLQAFTQRFRMRQPSGLAYVTTQPVYRRPIIPCVEI